MLLLACLFGGLYAAQAITGSMVQTALPTVLRDAGMALDRLSFLYVLFLPWALKFLWAPAIDRWSVARLGRRRSWILLCQLALLACFLVAALLPPDRSLGGLAVVLFAIACIAATQDTATDALGVDLAGTAAGTGRTSPRAMVAGAGVAGGYLGFLVGVGLWLPVYAAFGWATSMLAMTACILVATLPTWLARRIDRPAPPEAARPPSFLRPFTRRSYRSGLGFLLVHQTGVRLGIALIGPYLVDAGLQLATIGWIKGTGGAVVGLGAALAGIWLIRRFGTMPVLAAAALAAALGYGLLALAGASLPSPELAAALVLILGAVTALGFVSLYAAMMSWCGPEQTGTDFAILQSLDALLAIVMALAAGWIGERFGHGANFGIAGLVMLLAAGMAVQRIARPASDLSPSGSPS